jgi:deazaflavin-dependent oxidoreductase (nitroreductase family)
MDETFLYMTATGRKTGLPRSIEIWFVEHGGCYYMVAEHREETSWVKNIQSYPGVTFSVGTGSNHEATQPLTHATGRTVSPTDEPELVAAVSKLMDDKYDWSDGLIVELKPVQ